MKKILLAMSGGIDSSVCVELLRKQGFEVVGVHFVFFGSADSRIPALAQQLDMEIKIIDATREFQDIVIKNFLDEYKSGRTPSPCCLCNPAVKFEKLVQVADEIGIEKIATGHYTKIQNKKLLRGKNHLKDQSYFLYRLTPEVLDRCIFPLGEITDKSDVIEMGADLDIEKNSESQDFCFLEGKTLEDILRKNLPKENFHEGDIVDTSGAILGQHTGLPLYTIGQRKGLEIGGTGPWYVIDKNATKNQVIVGKPSDLEKNSLTANQLFFRETPDQNKTYTAKIRYGQNETSCKITIKNDTMNVDFLEKVSGISSGQSVVIYDDEICLGGGIII